MKFTVCAIDRELDGKRPFPLVAPSYAKCAEIAKELGFDGIELQIQDPTGYNGRELKRQFDDNGIGISAVTTGLAYLYESMSMVHPDKKIRQATVERLWRQLDLAKEIDSQVLVGFLRGRKAPGQSDEEFLSILRDSVWQVLRYAEDIRVPFVMEQINRNDGDVLCTTEQTMRFLESFGSDWLKYNGDTYHMITEDPDVPAAIRRSASKLVLFHVSDVGRLLPDDRHFNFYEAAEALKELDYNEWTGIECLPLPDSHSACKQGIEYLKRVFG